jgi:predicted transposase/invertase (TIGR01784 family)
MLHDLFAESEWAPTFEKQAEERGMLKGEQKGRLEGKLEAAQSLLKKGMDLETVSNLLDIPMETIKQGVQPGQPT